MDRPTCKSCAYFDVLVRIEDGKEFGQCHRYAPRSARHFPEVAPSDWCGEHDDFIKWKLDKSYVEVNLLTGGMALLHKDLVRTEAKPCLTSGSSVDPGITASKISGSPQP